MTRGSKRQRQLRKLRLRRQRRQVEIVGKAYRAVLDAKVKPTLRMSGLVDDGYAD